MMIVCLTPHAAARGLGGPGCLTLTFITGAAPPIWEDARVFRLRGLNLMAFLCYLRVIVEVLSGAGAGYEGPLIHMRLSMRKEAIPKAR